MRYVTSDQMKELDREAIVKRGIPASVLMENAGKAVAREAAAMIGRGNVMVFSGYGNNGGDGLVAARHLLKKGCSVSVFLVGRPKPFSPESQANLKALMKLKIVPETISTAKEIVKIFAQEAPPDLIIDAIFGIGIKKGLSAFYEELINRINNIGAPVLSVDLPSGLDSNTGEPQPLAVRACKTVTLGFPKVGFKNAGAKEYTGEVIVADIGI